MPQNSQENLRPTPGRSGSHTDRKTPETATATTMYTFLPDNFSPTKPKPSKELKPLLGSRCWGCCWCWPQWWPGATGSASTVLGGTPARGAAGPSTAVASRFATRRASRCSAWPSARARPGPGFLQPRTAPAWPFSAQMGAAALLHPDRATQGHSHVLLRALGGGGPGARWSTPCSWAMLGRTGTAAREMKTQHWPIRLTASRSRSPSSPAMLHLRCRLGGILGSATGCRCARPPSRSMTRCPSTWAGTSTERSPATAGALPRHALQAASWPSRCT